MKGIPPQVGNWYKDLQQGGIFEVVAVDDDHDTVEAQMLDGEICEYDLDSWDELLLENIEEPEDWRKPFELTGDDYRNPDDPLQLDDWSNPLSNIEPDVINGLIDDYL